MIDAVFCKFHIPVAEFIPDKVIYFLNCNSEFIFIHVLGHIFRQCVDLGQNPAVSRLQQRILRRLHTFFRHIHKDETGRVPHFIREVTARLHSLVVEAHIITRRVSCDKCKSQGVSAVFVDNLQRINTISKRFTHLSSLGISYETVDEYCMKR